MSDADDVLVPFQIEAGSVRGRLVRLGAALDAVLAGHDYPPAVASLLAETLALAVALAGALKYDGIFTLQVQGKGPVSLVVADVTSDGHLRGYARFDAPRVAEAEPVHGAVVPRLLGEGYLAFTVDQGADTERYQGIVALSGNTLADCADQYFRQSEQLDTAILLAVRPPADDAGWRVTGLMIQRMPLSPQSPILTAEEAQESWRRATILMKSATPRELLDPMLTSERLLYRLYHADGLVLHDPRALRARCRCSAERVEGTLRTFPRHDVEDMRDDHGRVVVVCEFCTASYVFGPEDLDRLYAGQAH